MEFTEQELQAAPASQSGSDIDEATTLSKVSRVPSGCVIDFFEARHRVTAGFEKNGKVFEIKRKASKVAARQLPSLGRIDRIEESLYWLISAATLIYLVLSLIGF